MKPQALASTNVDRDCVRHRIRGVHRRSPQAASRGVVRAPRSRTRKRRRPSGKQPEREARYNHSTDEQSKVRQRSRIGDTGEQRDRGSGRLAEGRPRRLILSRQHYLHPAPTTQSNPHKRSARSLQPQTNSLSTWTQGTGNSAGARRADRDKGDRDHRRKFKSTRLKVDLAPRQPTAPVREDTSRTTPFERSAPGGFSKRRRIPVTHTISRSTYSPSGSTRARHPAASTPRAAQLPPPTAWHRTAEQQPLQSAETRPTPGSQASPPGDDSVLNGDRLRRTTISKIAGH